MLLRFTEDYFDPNQTATIGVDFQTKTLRMSTGEVAKLTIWDTAGQERYRTLTASYYRGAEGVILMYDVNDAASFQNLHLWLREVNAYTGRTEPPVIIVVGSKVDLDQRKVTREEGEHFAAQNKTLFVETSSATDMGVRDAFEELVHKILETHQANQKPTGVQFGQQDGAAMSGCCGS